MQATLQTLEMNPVYLLVLLKIRLWLIKQEQRALSANLTQSDFDLLNQDLTEARQALENNDTTALLDELNSASGELFQVSSRQFDPDHVEAMTEQFNPLQTHIDRAQETALKDNHTGTLQELSAADSELSAIVQMLPSG